MINFYSNNCPRCRMLETRLKSTNIPYKKTSEFVVLNLKGIMTVPVLEVDGEFLDFEKAMIYLNNNI